jgi:hypothetical protein
MNEAGELHEINFHFFSVVGVCTTGVIVTDKMLGNDCVAAFVAFVTVQNIEQNPL